MMVTPADLMQHIEDILYNADKSAMRLLSEQPTSYHSGYADAVSDLKNDIEGALYAYGEMISQGANNEF
jgi:hypothetical protein